MKPRLPSIRPGVHLPGHVVLGSVGTFVVKPDGTLARRISGGREGE